MINIDDIFESWSQKEGINSTKSIIALIEEKNKTINVNISKISLQNCTGWFLDDDGFIRNTTNSFFQINGIKYFLNETFVAEQPIIIQDEIGYLGIIVKKINNVLHFLMQAKIEPGNVNKVQISPTIQATKSNFEQKHGGEKPAYLDYFLNAGEYDIIVDQIQSEQSSRFVGKRNRNIIIDIGDTDIEVLPSHFWLTLGQIKELMKLNNLVNMDTRTVLSCLPMWKNNVISNDDLYKKFDSFFVNSLINDDDIENIGAFNKINNFKMFNEVKKIYVPITNLKEREFEANKFVCKQPYNFDVIFCNLSIEGREVKKWCQPLFEATGKALFLLFCAKFGSKYKYLISLKSEIGSFDKIELGPTVQCEGIELEDFYKTKFGLIFKKYININQRVKNDVILSEEGGRFYHEENRNVIMEVDRNELTFLDNNKYIWLDFKTLNFLVQFNNVLNIQLRNLLSLIGGQ